MTSDLLQSLRENGVSDLLPGDLEQQLRSLGLSDVSVTNPSSDVTVVRGTVAPVGTGGGTLPRVGALPIEAPGLTSGLRAQLAVRTSGGEVAQWALDLDLDRVALVVPGLRPAREQREPARATRLVDEPSRTDVRVVGRGVLRIAATGGATPEVSLVDRLDATTPFAPRGPVATLNFEPPSFFLGGSSFGFTVEELVYDQSPTSSPSGRLPAWRGLGLKRATFYLPPGAPVVGDVSVGVENLWLGDPVGVDGTATLEFGGAADTPLLLTVEQQVGTTWQSLAVSGVSATGTRPDAFTAALQGSQPPAARVRAGLSTTPVGAVKWRLPHGQTDPTGFDVLPGDFFDVRVDSAAPTTCTFTGTWTAEPTVDLTLGGLSWTNVTSLTGKPADLAGATFAHSASTDTFAWSWDGGSETSGTTRTIPTTASTGSYVLALRRGGRTIRRVRVDLRATGPVLVGCRAGTFTTGGTPPTGTRVDVLDVSGTYGLVGWHHDGLLSRAIPAATVSSGAVSVEAARIAEVVTAATDDGSTPPVTPAPPVADRAHVQFVFDSRELKPADSFWLGEQSRLIDDGLATWIASLGSTAKLAVVGRCDDLGTATYNAGLAVQRAERTRDLLVAAGVDPSRIALRGEQTGWTTGAPTASPGELPADAITEQWKARSTPDYLKWGAAYPSNDTERAPLRRGDIYAYDVTPTTDAQPPAQDRETLSPTRLRALVPGADPTTVSGSVVPSAPMGRPQYRVRVEVEWNDPTARSITDSWPVRAEVLVQWPAGSVRMPTGPNAALTRPGDTSGTPPVWSLRGRWAHDRTAGTDQFTLSLDVAGTPDGIAAIDSKVLAASMGLAPAVIGAASGGGGGGGSTVAGEDAATVGALIAVIGTVASSLLRDGSRTVVTGVTIDHLQRGESAPGSRTRLTVDYTVELSVDVRGSGLPLNVRTRADKPMKLRYKGVGVEIDTGKADWWDGIGLHARDVSPEIVDPGSWQLGSPLDDLLRVTGARSGAQSSWLEVDLAVSLDLGVVKLSNATVRVVFDGASVKSLELRALTASVDIPATLKGEGAVDVANGAIRAAVELDIVPLKVGAVADLSLGPNGFVALFVGVRFPAPIPFANSGLGLFGVAGRFVTNGTRAIDPGPDPVGRELAWLAKPDKYRGEPGQYALGLGAVVGTVPDFGFTFHALGMLTVEFPRPTIIFSVIAKILGETAPVPREQASRPSSGLSIIGLVVIDDTAVTIALRGNYEIPGILVLDVPVGAWFPYANPTSSWVHVGTDGQPGREGSAVTATLLPGILDVRAWAFVLVHGNGLTPGLRGNADFTFSGFAIGFGAGFDVDWSAGPIRLSASAEVLAGFGTNPRFLAAGIFVRGELDLVVLSISARGEITLKTDGNRTDLRGEFCGEVDCFFFSISGCVEIDVSATLSGPPDPPSPVVGVDLVSRRGLVAGTAVQAGTPPAVWPDTIPVVHFAHTVENGVSGGQFAVGTPMPGPVWSGSRDVKHAFRITSVRLEPTSGAAFDPPAGEQFPTAWWWPGIRSSTKPPWLSASESEPRDLALLTWEPWTGLLPLTRPDGSPGDPGPLVDDLCEPVRTPDPLCLVGGLAMPNGPGRADLPQDPAYDDPALPPALLRLAQPADRPWATLVAVAVTAGCAVRPGALAALENPVALAEGGQRATGWRLASLVRGGQDLGAVGAHGTYDPALDAPSLVLEVCPVQLLDREQPPVDVPDGCVDFAPLGPNQLPPLTTEDGTVLRYGGLVVRDLRGGRLQPVDFDGNGEWALLLLGGGLRVELREPTDEVSLRAVIGQQWQAVAYDGDGREVDQADAPEGTTLTLRGEGIVAVEVFAEGEGGLAAVCLPAADPTGETGTLLRWVPEREQRLEPPVVLGVLPDGSTEPWKPHVKAGRRCLTVSYVAPYDGPWSGVRIAAAPGRTVTVVGSCGVRWHEALERRQAEEHRTDVVAGFAKYATGPHDRVRASAAAAGTVDPAGVVGNVNLPVVLVGPPTRPLLAPATTYRVTVDWQWQRWERTSSSPSPGTPDGSKWKNGTPTSYTFSTASLASLPAPPPAVDLIAESTFDPRALARYVTGAQPAGPLPHLLDDPIRVLFSVDYVAALLDRYAHDARVEVRPTDVPTASVPDGKHPLDIVTGVKVKAWKKDRTLMPVEERVVDSAVAVPCVPDTGLGGTAVEVLAPLEPDRAYDLLLVADPRATGSASSVVQRWHFRTSRYRDVDEILRVLGLPPGAPSAVTPDDVLLDRQWPTLPSRPWDDAELDGAMTALALDPWPLSSSPRTTTLWVPPDPSAGRTAWALAGVLLEAPEPVGRKDRIAVSATVGATPLAVLRSTASGTRVLRAAAAPVVPAAADALAVQLVDGLRGRTATGSAQLLGGPRTVRREVP